MCAESVAMNFVTPKLPQKLFQIMPPKRAPHGSPTSVPKSRPPLPKSSAQKLCPKSGHALPKISAQNFCPHGGPPGGCQGSPERDVNLKPINYNFWRPSWAPFGGGLSGPGPPEDIFLDPLLDPHYGPPWSRPQADLVRKSTNSLLKLLVAVLGGLELGVQHRAPKKRSVAPQGR